MSKDNVTLKQIDDLHTKIEGLKTIGEWKICVKEFAVENDLTDREAIAIANMKR